MDAAVVIPTITINPLVQRCVDACLETAPGAEIIVLADTLDGALALPVAVTILETGPLTISAKRNRGVEATSKANIGFIDSDAYPAEGWLQNGIEILKQDARIGIAGGPNVSPPNSMATERYVGGAQRSFLVTGHYNFRKKIAHARFCDDLPSCNMVVRRSDYVDLGGMDENLYIFEDKDFCVRMIKSGKRIHYSPDVLVYHRDRPLGSFFVQRAVWGGDLWNAMPKILSFSKLYLFLPMLAVLFFLSGVLIPLAPLWAVVYVPVSALYGVVVLIESGRNAASILDIPGVALAILIGNLGPGIGSIAQPLRMMPDVRKIYRNDD